MVRAYEARLDLAKLVETARQADGADASSISKDEPEVPIPLVIVVHDAGLTEHARRVARRLALNVKVACAVDLFSREGGTECVEPQERRALLDARGTAFFVQDIQAAADFYKSQPYADANELGVLGFGFGGGVAWQAVAAMPELKAAVCFYGEPPELSSLAHARAATMGVYSSDPTDPANERRDETAAALAAYGVPHRIVVHPNTRSGFFDETGPTYSPLASLRAWSDLDGWYRQYLRIGARDRATPRKHP